MQQISEALQQGEMDNIQEDNSVPESGTWSFISESVMPGRVRYSEQLVCMCLLNKTIIGLRQKKTKQMDIP